MTVLVLVAMEAARMQWHADKKSGSVKLAGMLILKLKVRPATKAKKGTASRMNLAVFKAQVGCQPGSQSEASIEDRESHPLKAQGAGQSKNMCISLL